MKLLNNKVSGIVIATGYALIIRLLFSHPALKASILKFSLFSVTFLFIVPLLIGCIPILFSDRDKKISLSFSVWSPAVSVLLFFFIALITKLEDAICVWILVVPFMLIAITGGVIIRFIIMRKRKKNGLIYSLLLIPALASMAESKFTTPKGVYTFTNTTVINTTPDKVWPNIIRVKEIGENEYNKGFFYYSGVPRPLYAELDMDTTGGTRIGHFQGGLRFVEKVSVWERNKKILFDITVDEASIGTSVFDNHILKGGHFRFLNACYELKPLGNKKTVLSLTSSYELGTNVNAYGSFWGQYLLDDFQGRLLEVLKKRCDHL